MYILKAFAQINPLINNTLATVAPLGELGPIGWSYSREKAIHASVASPGILLNTFTSNQDGVKVAPDSVFATEVIDVIGWIYQEAAAGRFSQNRDSFQTRFITQFGEDISLNDSGAMVNGVNIWCPAYIDFSFKAGPTNRVKVWMSGDAFINEYDDYEIFVVSPVDDLDVFFGSYATVKNAVAELTVPELMAKVNQVKGGYPETNVVTNTFDWIDDLDRTLKVPVNWTVVIYGAAGDNLDNIKQAIVQYILANTTHTREEWEVIFPDIFTSTEFILTPMWNNYSIPNMQLQTGLYSTIVPMKDALNLSKLTCKGTGYTDAHIEDSLQVFPTIYKQLAIAAVGGPKNRDGIDKFNRQWRDYLSVPSTWSDFLRMDDATRNFVIQMNTMLLHAESMTPTSSVPREHSRTIREGIMYLSKTIDRVQYLVVTKYSLNDATTGVGDVLTDGDGYRLIDDEDQNLTA